MTRNDPNSDWSIQEESPWKVEKNHSLVWEFPKGFKRGMQEMFVRDQIQETTLMFWLHSLSIVKI